MIRYYGLYSNAHRGKMRKAGCDPLYPLITEEGPTYVPSKGWAEMIRKRYEVDPLCCPTCGGQISIISSKEEPKTIDRIISHLELTFEAERPPPPRVVQQDLLMAAEESGKNLEGPIELAEFLKERKPDYAIRVSGSAIRMLINPISCLEAYLFMII